MTVAVRLEYAHPGRLKRPGKIRSNRLAQTKTSAFKRRF